MNCEFLIVPHIVYKHRTKKKKKNDVTDQKESGTMTAIPPWLNHINLFSLKHLLEWRKINSLVLMIRDQKIGGPTPTEWMDEWMDLSKKLEIFKKNSLDKGIIYNEEQLKFQVNTIVPR